MSDEQIREAERCFRSAPTEENARAWVMLRRRGGEEGIEGLKVLRFAKCGYKKSWKLALHNLDQPWIPCKKCKGEGKCKTWGDKIGECWDCDGLGTEDVEYLQMAEVNKILDRISGGFLIGRWRRTKKEKYLRWLGP